MVFLMRDYVATKHPVRCLSEGFSQPRSRSGRRRQSLYPGTHLSLQARLVTLQVLPDGSLLHQLAPDEVHLTPTSGGRVSVQSLVHSVCSELVVAEGQTCLSYFLVKILKTP